MNGQQDSSPKIQLELNESGGNKPRLKILLILLALVGVSGFGYWYWTNRSEGPRVTENPETEEDIDIFFQERGESWDRNLRGVDSQHIYSVNGLFVDLEGETFHFKIQEEIDHRDIKYVSFVDKHGIITSDTKVFILVQDAEGNLTPQETTLDELRPDDRVDVKSMANLLAVDGFDIKEIVIIR